MRIESHCLFSDGFSSLIFLPIFNCFYAKVFIFYSHLKMAAERSKRRDLLACIFIAKSIENCSVILIDIIHFAHCHHISFMLQAHS